MVESYCDHTIVTATSPDKVTSRYIALASVSWKAENNRRDFYVYDSSPVHYLRPEEADQAALSHAKSWVEHRVKFANHDGNSITLMTDRQ